MIGFIFFIKISPRKKLYHKQKEQNLIIIIIIYVENVRINENENNFINEFHSIEVPSLFFFIFRSFQLKKSCGKIRKNIFRPGGKI